MYEDIISKHRKCTEVTEAEFKVLFCTICELYKNCKYDALKECIEEFKEE